MHIVSVVCLNLAWGLLCSSHSWMVWSYIIVLWYGGHLHSVSHMLHVFTLEMLKCVACLWCVGRKYALSRGCMKISGAVLQVSFEIWTDILCGCVYGWMNVCAQEYLRLSDVYKMYGNGCIPAQTAFPNALCLPLAVTSDTPREVWLLHSLFHPRQNLFLCLTTSCFPLQCHLFQVCGFSFYDAVRITFSWNFSWNTFSFQLSLSLLYPMPALCFCIPKMPSLHFVFVCDGLIVWRSMWQSVS